MAIRPRNLTARTAAVFGAAALALVMGTVAGSAATGVVSYAEGVVTLSITPGSAGITALDSACPGSQVTMTGNGTGFTQIGAGSQDTGAFVMSGGACASNGVPSGLMVVTVSSPDKYTTVDPTHAGGFSLDWGSHFCPTMSGNILQVGAIVEFSVTGDCVINAWHTGPMTYTSVGITAGSLAASEVDNAVYSSAQEGAACC
jgi:hypothetical protein